MKIVNQIKIFISCTSEIKEETDSIKLIIDEINKTSGKHSGYVIESLNWNLDTYTQIGEDAQEVINNQIDAQYDILVALLWQRIGTPTRRDKSGTIEEINNAITNKKEILLYFKTTPPENLNLIDLDQLNKINLFKKELQEKGVLYKEFNKIEAFESLFRINILNLINDRLLSEKLALNELTPQTTQFDKYRSISSLIEEVESNSEKPIDNLDFFALIEEMLSYLASVTTSTNSMTGIYNELTAKLNLKTTELERFVQIKDNKLRIDKIRIVVDLLASELDEFNSRMNKELQSFSENFILIGPTYSKINSFVSAYEDIDEIIAMRKSVLNFKFSIEGAVENSAGVLKVIMGWPPMTPRFNKSKRSTEITIKDITKEMLAGLKLLNEAIHSN
ncbi:MAG: hypothetical protein JST68_04415 [Bacteroidetes bacterium]|nr:hypothetical protein [Bacteroidota bacterium]